MPKPLGVKTIILNEISNTYMIVARFYKSVCKEVYVFLEIISHLLEEIYTHTCAEIKMRT